MKHRTGAVVTQKALGTAIWAGGWMRARGMTVQQAAMEGSVLRCWNVNVVCLRPTAGMLISRLVCQCFLSKIMNWEIIFFMTFWLVCTLTAQSTRLMSCQAGQFTYPHFSWAEVVLLMIKPVVVHILSPETDNCIISGRQEDISWSTSTKQCSQTRRGSNTQLPNHQSYAQQTEPPRLSSWPTNTWNNSILFLCVRSFQGQIL